MADNLKYVQAQKFRLAGSGVTSSATSIILQSLTTPDDTELTMADFGTVAYMVLEPGTSREENISFTGVTQNADGTATLSGVTRGLGFVSPYTTVANNQKSHGGGAIAIVSNPAPFYDTFVNKNNDETILGTHSFTAVPNSSADPVSDNDLTRKSYVVALINGGTISVDRTVVAGQAGETISAGQFIYLDLTDNEWKKCDADTAATVQNVLLGIAQGAGTDGNAISGGVLLNGTDSNQSGLNQGDLVYASNTAGGISASAGTTERVIGIARNTTSFYFDPYFYYALTAAQKAALAGTTGTPSASNKFVTEEYRVFTPVGMVSPFAGAAAPTGWLLCDGSAVSRATYAALFTAISTTYGVGDGSTTFNLPDLKGRSVIGAGAGTKVATFASRSSNVITVTGISDAANNEFQTGQAVLYTAASGAMTGLTHNTTYYLIRTGNLTFSLASSLANAIAGTAIALSSDGTGTQTFTLTLTTRTLSHTGGEENHSLVEAELPAHQHGGVVVSGTGGGGGSGGNSRSTSTTSGSTGGSTAHNNMSPFLALNYIIKT